MEAVLYVHPCTNPEAAEKEAANTHVTTNVGNEDKQEAQHRDP